MDSIIVIPSRYGSTRFPGKPLSMIAGKSLIQRVYAIAKSVRGVDEVVVATDDERIEKHVAAFGGRAVMTSPECDNGTERVFDLLKRLNLKPKIAVNFQGDAVLTPPAVLETLVGSMRADPSATFATPAVQLTGAQYDELLQSKSKVPSGTLVTFDRNFNALYFSRSVIPFLRSRPQGALPVYKHIGIYGYTFDVLERYLTLEPTVLEAAEGLEQLRALENGMRIRVVPVDCKGRTLWSVDSPEDSAKAEAIIKREGELVS